MFLTCVTVMPPSDRQDTPAVQHYLGLGCVKAPMSHSINYRGSS